MDIKFLEDEVNRIKHNCDMQNDLLSKMLDYKHKNNKKSYYHIYGHMEDDKIVIDKENLCYENDDLESKLLKKIKECKNDEFIVQFQIDDITTFCVITVNMKRDVLVKCRIHDIIDDMKNDIYKNASISDKLKDSGDRIYCEIYDGDFVLQETKFDKKSDMMDNFVYRIVVNNDDDSSTLESIIEMKYTMNDYYDLEMTKKIETIINNKALVNKLHSEIKYKNKEDVIIYSDLELYKYNIVKVNNLRFSGVEELNELVKKCRMKEFVVCIVIKLSTCYKIKFSKIRKHDTVYFQIEDLSDSDEDVKLLLNSSENKCYGCNNIIKKNDEDIYMCDVCDIVYDGNIYDG